MAAEASPVFARGVAALEANDFAAAERLFRAIVQQDPRAHEAWNALSVVAVRAGLPADAAAHSRRALELARRNPVYLNNLGVALGELGEFADAEAQLRRALKLQPVYAEALFNLGKVLHKQGRLADSLRAYERAYAMDPAFPGLRRNLAQLYQLHARPERALAVLREAPEGMDDSLVPTFAECLAELEGAQSAVGWLRGLAPGRERWRRLRFSLGLMLLSIGEWRAGWQGYVARGDMDKPVEPVAELPARLDGKRVLLGGDQGLGDVIFFLRFVRLLRDRGARVTLQCPAPLFPLLGGNTAIDALVDASVDPAAFDFQLLIGDLPAALGAEVVAPAFPLSCDKALGLHSAQRLAALGPPPYLGLTWRAGTDVLRQREHGNVINALSKEIAPARLGEAVSGWRGTLLCLQRNPYPGELAAVETAAGAKVHDLSAANADLAEMLAILTLLEDYVTVSNTNVHLMAGIAKGARVLVPYPPEWRWMREGDISSWFPGCRVYRQPPSRDWSQPLGRLRAELIR
jgi:Flp pilus assembly protein TadD